MQNTLQDMMENWIQQNRIDEAAKNALDDGDMITPLDADDLELLRIEREEVARMVNTQFGFAKACPIARCRRHRRCSGDPAMCHAIFWPVVPEEAKVWWQALLDSRRTNRSFRQASRAAEAARRDFQLRARALERLAKAASVASHK
jgi:hypothetical protein